MAQRARAPGEVDPIPAAEFSRDYARRYLIPAMDGSIAVSHADGAGEHSLYAVIPGGENHLLQENADGGFTDITERAKVAGSGSDLGAAFGDFDHSGRQSLFVAGLGGVRLYRNDGDGTYSDVTDKAGLRGTPGELATSVLLFDADGDGFLDILETIYTDLSSPPAKTSFKFPNDFAGASSRLYRNQHDGTFRDVTESAGLDSNPGRTRRAVAADFSGDGRMDLLLLRDDKPPVFYRNQGQGKFEDATWEAGQEIWKYAYLDAQIADLNHDGKPDIALWSTVSSEALWNAGAGKFRADEQILPVIYAANRPFGFHGTVVDLDGKGYTSLLTRDAGNRWRLLANRNGEFSQASVEFVAEKSQAGKNSQESDSLPAMASLIAFRMSGADQVRLLGLTVDGRIMVFEKQSAAAKKSARPLTGGRSE
ncbi:MAG TPA: VCBS repeat-containing protein [Candidatus Aquilonibacter sp.]|nr:VCBS repeat-containing protein [Candidatus Aquilonibacter sp.]